MLRVSTSYGRASCYRLHSSPFPARISRGMLSPDDHAQHHHKGAATMQLGIHLPHAGSQATPALIKEFARRAEDMGLSDVWGSEHIIVPRAQFPRSPLFYAPVRPLAGGAAVTPRVRLGTSVIVLPLRHPLPLAKELSTLHNLSGGRLILRGGVGGPQPA